MPRKQRYRIQVILKNEIIRDEIAKDWNSKERYIEELQVKYPKARITAEAIVPKVRV